MYSPLRLSFPFESVRLEFILEAHDRKPDFSPKLDEEAVLPIVRLDSNNELYLMCPSAYLLYLN